MVIAGFVFDSTLSPIAFSLETSSYVLMYLTRELKINTSISITLLSFKPQLTCLCNSVCSQQPLVKVKY